MQRRGRPGALHMLCGLLAASPLALDRPAGGSASSLGLFMAGERRTKEPLSGRPRARSWLPRRRRRLFRLLFHPPLPPSRAGRGGAAQRREARRSGWAGSCQRKPRRAHYVIPQHRKRFEARIRYVATVRSHINVPDTMCSGRWQAALPHIEQKEPLRVGRETALQQPLGFTGSLSVSCRSAAATFY